MTKQTLFQLLVDTADQLQEFRYTTGLPMNIT